MIGKAEKYQGTDQFSSLALLKAKSAGSVHTYQKRDDLEALFSVLLYWVNEMSHPFRPGCKCESLLDSWNDILKGVQDHRKTIGRRDIDNDFQDLEKVWKILYEGYGTTDEIREVDYLFN